MSLARVSSNKTFVAQELDETIIKSNDNLVKFEVDML